jgi:hypothetical protein
MGDIGPQQQHFEVLPIPAYGIEDADRWTVPPPLPVPDPMPLPEPTPIPDPGPTPDPGPDPAPLPSV